MLSSTAYTKIPYFADFYAFSLCDGVIFIIIGKKSAFPRNVKLFCSCKFLTNHARIIKKDPANGSVCYF